MGDLDESSDQLPIDLTRQIDDLCDEYEVQLRQGGLPEIEPYLRQIDAGGRAKLLHELLCLTDDHLRREAVEDPAASILSRNPTLRASVEEFYAARSDHAETVQFDGQIQRPNAPLSTPRRKRSRGLHIRCPHCSNHVELIGDADLETVDCTVCGSTFSLINRSEQTRMAEALQQIDRFEVIARLGVGGFGTVWKARDTELDRAVAIKIPRYGQLTADEQEQFFREARSVAQLRHPNIVPVHEVGREGDAVFIVSELVRGVSLADLLTSRRPAARETAELCLTVADALDHAHRRGVVHRDLKPSNIMMDEQGTPHLMDFGLAKREAEEIAMTVDGQIVGTPAYMSPEQAQGRSAWADSRTDIYSIGVILFEMLTGELPFRGNAQMQVHLRVTEDAPSVRTLNRHIPLDLATICAKCLEREPGRRYQSAQELADDLKSFLIRAPIKARPLSPLGRSVRWVERYPLRAVVALLVLVLAVGGPAVAFVIESQRQVIQAKYDEIANLDHARAEEGDAGRQGIAERDAEILRLKGDENAWEVWPPRPETAPRRQQLLSLYHARRDALREDDGPDDARLYRLLSLAAIHQSTGAPSAAKDCLVEATELLDSPQQTAPRAVLAYADCCERLSFLTGADNAAESELWLEKSVGALRRLAEQSPQGAFSAALLQEAEMRLAIQGGGPAASDQLGKLQGSLGRLKSLWPDDPQKLYVLASALAGRTPWYSESAANQVTGSPP